MINKLEIYNLFNQVDISIPFNDSKAKIFISENGLGKTTVLKILYAVLSRKFYKLASLVFDSIHLSFDTGEIDINKKDMEGYLFDKTNFSNEINEIKNSLSENNFITLLDSARFLSSETIKELPLMQYLFKIMPKIPKSYLIQLIKNNKIELDKSLSLTDMKIAELFTSDILYLPTYRRIEEDLRMLGLDDIDVLKVDEIFRSGMHDIQKKIDRVLSEVKSIFYKRISDEDQQQIFFRITNSLYGINTGETDDFDYIKTAMGNIYQEIENCGIESIIKRLDISALDDKIGTLNKSEMLKELILDYKDIYEYYQNKINLITNFIDKCNKYLIDKFIQFSEKSETLQIVMNKKYENDNEENYNLNIMSSGEKQIISLFSRLYFDLNIPGLIIIDEPENSLSIEWQRNLLPDMFSTPNCDYIIAATHSPFIFDNELNIHTVALSEYIRRSK